jgi:hypothetical protein
MCKQCLHQPQAMFISYLTISDMTMLALVTYMKIMIEWKYPVYPYSRLVMCNHLLKFEANTSYASYTLQPSVQHVLQLNQVTPLGSWPLLLTHSIFCSVLQRPYCIHFTCLSGLHWPYCICAVDCKRHSRALDSTTGNTGPGYDRKWEFSAIIVSSSCNKIRSICRTHIELTDR